MSRRNGQRRNVANPKRVRGVIKTDDRVLTSRTYDEEEGGKVSPYNLAVDCVLEALEGLWFETDDAVLELQVNDFVQQMKRKVQEIL